MATQQRSWGVRGAGRWATAGAVFAAAGLAMAQPAIVVVPPLKGDLQSEALGVSADGSVVVGSSQGPTVQEAIRWSIGGGTVGLGLLPTVGSTYSFATAISDDGTTIVGGADRPGASTLFNDQLAVRWVGGVGPQLLPAQLGTFNEARGVSANGLVVCGLYDSGAGTRGFVWNNGSFSDVGNLGNFTVLANAVSANGAVVVGETRIGLGAGAPTVAYRTVGGVMMSLGTPPGGTTSSASAITRDGTAITGRVGIGTTSAYLFKWTSAGYQNLGLPAGFDNVRGMAISADGNTIGGWASTSVAGSMRAMLWNPAIGIVDLNVYLPTVGVSLTGWQLSRIDGISADGKTVVGTGAFNGQIVGFVVSGLFTTANVCSANCDGSSTAPVLGPADFSCFLGKFRAGDAYANCDGSTTAPVLGPADFSCFLAKFRAGC